VFKIHYRTSLVKNHLVESSARLKLCNSIHLMMGSMQLQKEVKSNPKQPSYKKKCAAFKEAIVKKM